MSSTYITDWRGRVRVVEQRAGVKVELLVEPSQKYLDWLETVKSPPEWEYMLTSEIKIAPNLPATIINSKSFRFPRELTISEEAQLKNVTKMNIKAKRKI